MTIVYLGILLFAVFYVWPLVNLTGTSVGWEKISFHGYVKAIKEPVYREVILNTLRISLLVTIFCLLVGYPYAKLLSYLQGTTRKVAYVIAVLPIFVNPLAVICAWRIILERYGLVNRLLLTLGLVNEPIALCYNIFSVTLVMTYLLLPFVVLPCYAAIASLDRSLLAAAQNLGASTLQIFLRVELPLCMPSIATGALLAFVLALGYFVVPAVLGGSGETMISMLIARQFNILFDWELASSLSVLLGLSVIILLTVGLTLVQLWERKLRTVI